MYRAGREEHVQPLSRSILKCGCRKLDIFALAASQPANRRTGYIARNHVYRAPVAARRCRKSRFDDIHAEIGERVSYAKLLLQGHAAAGRLLAIAQGCIEDQY